MPKEHAELAQQNNAQNQTNFLETAKTLQTKFCKV